MDLLVALTFVLIGYVAITSKGGWKDWLIVLLGVALAIAHFLPHET